MVKNSRLYKELENLIHTNFKNLEKAIQQYLLDAKFNLEVYIYKEKTGWYIEIDFDDYQWSGVLIKPHWMHLSIYLTEIENDTVVLTISNFKNSFELHSEDYEYGLGKNFRERHINLQSLEDETVIAKELKVVKDWIDTIYAQFTKGIDIIDRNDLISYKHYEQIMDIEKKIKTLKERDTSFTLLGSEEHKYELNKPISKEEINTFETKYQIYLPEGYRHFLLEIGNGGTGPYYGLKPLENSDEYITNLSNKFSHKRAWNNFNEENERTTFLDWYEMWLDHSLVELDNNDE